LTALGLPVQPHHTDVLFAGALLRLDQASGSVDAHNQTPSDLWIQRTRVSSLFSSQDSTHPRYDFVRRWVGWLVQVDDAVPNVVLQVTFEWGTADWNRRVMTGADVEAVIVAEEEGPLGSVYRRGDLGGGNDVVVLLSSSSGGGGG
jgi:hypothetical protein